MNLHFGTSQSTIMPVLIDTESSQTHVLLRRNVQQKTRQEEGREPETYYEYEECQLTKLEYQQYMNEQLMAENAALKARAEENEQAMMELAARIEEINDKTDENSVALMEVGGMVADMYSTGA